MLLLLLSLVLSLVLVDAQGQCLTASQQEGNCMDVKECTEINNTIPTQQLKPNKIKHLHESQCGKHNGQILVCCPVERQPIEENVTISLTPQQEIIESRSDFLTFSSFVRPGTNQEKPGNTEPPAQFSTFNSFLKPGAIQPIHENPPRLQLPQQPNRRPPGQASTSSSARPRPQPVNQQKRRPTVQGSTSSLFPQPGVCGKGAGATDKIYGGVETEIDEYSWLALIEYSRGDNSYGFLCGGSLINNRYVLTAAHCIKSVAIPSDLLANSVRLGEWNTDTTIDCKTDIYGIEKCADPPINVPIESTIIHENYNGTSINKHHDIALIRLANTVSYTQFISPVCLPLSTNLRISNLDGSVFDVVGWGRTESKSRSTVKLKASVDTVDLETCNSIFGQSKVTLKNGQICAGGKEGVDSCSGDSGGPLIGIDSSNKKQHIYFLAGIVSFGIKKCASDGWPGVYTRVGHYIDWIEKNMKT